MLQPLRCFPARVALTSAFKWPLPGTWYSSMRSSLSQPHSRHTAIILWILFLETNRVSGRNQNVLSSVSDIQRINLRSNHPMIRFFSKYHNHFSNWWCWHFVYRLLSQKSFAHTGTFQIKMSLSCLFCPKSRRIPQKKIHYPFRLVTQISLASIHAIIPA